jgi:hypothetical protein
MDSEGEGQNDGKLDYVILKWSFTIKIKRSVLIFELLTVKSIR